ncbi:MAG: leucine-rich repeat protein, partial [Desulfotomaculaceae bacterium]|nr:leucine-rich repeat protein [Desulfotomaculaceae bacterium]
MKKICFSMLLVFLIIFLGGNSVFAADTTEDFEGWGFVDGTPALSGGEYTYDQWRFVAKIDGAAANDGAIETWTGPAALSISTGGGLVDELRIINNNGEFNFCGFNFTGSDVRSMFVTGWRDGVQVTQSVNINYTDSTNDELFDMRSLDPEFKNIDEIRICGSDLVGGDYDKISGYLESLTYDNTPTDEVAPTASTLTMTSNNANATVAKVGDTISLNFTANEDIQIPTVTIANHNDTVVTAATNSGTGYSYDTGSKTLTISANSGPENFYSDHFSLRGEVKTVIIANGVTAPNYYAFSGYTSLTSVTIPSSVTKIAAGTFSGCTSLTTITIPNTVTEMLDYVFFGCTALKNVTLPSGMNSIPKSTFSGCTSLESFTIPSIVTSIGESAFGNCNNLKSITIPSQVTSIGADAFKNCTSLGSITIPSKVSSIGEWAFYNCTSLTSAIFQNSMTALPQSIFYNCGNLSSVTLPSNLQTIGIDAFRSCTSLSSINIPSTVTLIDSRAFQDCSNLSAVNFASTSALDVINDYSFDGCSSLSFIIIPSKVTRLGYNAFSGCTNITAVFDPPVAPVLDAYGIVFQNADGYKLYVPKTGTGYSGYGWTNLVVGNVGLSNLTLSSGELSPAFSFNQYSYTATVPTGTGSITVTPTSFRGEAITVNGTSVVSGQPSNAISLTEDTTTVTIQATYDATVETYTIQVTKAPAIVDIFTLDGKVTAPAKNGIPSVTAIDTAQYTGTVSWKDAFGADVGSKFLGGTAYTATVTLTPKQGYTFQGVLANQFTCSNAAVTHSAGGDGNLIVSIAFPPTAARTLSSIAITAQPKTSYKYGETFSEAGMVVKATYDDGATDNNFTDYTVDKTGPLTMSDTTVTLTARGTAIKTTLNITINQADGPDAPSLTFSFDGADANKLMGANSTMQYSLDGGVAWSNCTEDMMLADTQISADKDIKVRIKETSTTLAGETQTIDILAGPAAPNGITATDCTTTENNNGKLSGITTAMEYKLSTASSWMAVSSSEITGLISGTYDVRFKATGQTLPGSPSSVTINKVTANAA